MVEKRKKLFTITKKDFDIKFFRAGGKGGQKQNKTSSACRIVHKESGAVGESREERSQYANRKIAFNRLVNSEKFKNWLRIESSARFKGYQDIQDMIDENMKNENLKIEVVEEGEWREIK